MTCPFELYMDEQQPDRERCKACFWWLHTTDKCIIQGLPEQKESSAKEEQKGVRTVLDSLGFPVKKVGYRNLLTAMELLCACKEPGPGDITRIFQQIGRDTKRSTASVRQSIRTVIIWAWETGRLKEAFPNRQKRPRVLELYYYMKNSRIFSG